MEVQQSQLMPFDSGAAKAMQCRCRYSPLVAQGDTRHYRDNALFATYLSGEFEPVKVPVGRA